MLGVKDPLAFQAVAAVTSMQQHTPGHFDPSDAGEMERIKERDGTDGTDDFAPEDFDDPAWIADEIGTGTIG